MEEEEGVHSMSSGHRRDERIVLECGSCNERTILGGPEEVWLSERTSFECGCGRVLTLAGLPEHPEQVQEVLLVGGALRELALSPLFRERLGRLM